MGRRTIDELENAYKAELQITLRHMFRGIVILKNDSGYQQGIPDWSLFWGIHWAWLEVKAYEDAPQQPNQDFFVDQAHQLSFGAFIYPENEAEVLNDLRTAWGAGGETCILRRQ